MIGGSSKVERSKQRFYLSLALGLLLVAIFVGVIYEHPLDAVYQFAAMAIGGGVGAVEIMGRYRHAPLRAALSWSGFFYIVVNISAAWTAYYLLETFNVFPSASDAPLMADQRAIKLVLAAGFGALVFLRSSVFKVRVGDTDVGIGPAAVLDTLLLIADRGVDRREAVARAHDVSELVLRVRDYRIVANMLTKYSLALMQNVDEKTSKDLGEAIGKILSDAEIPDAIKTDIVALRLGVVVGPDVIEAAVEALGDRLNSAPAPSSPPAGAVAPASAPSAPPPIFATGAAPSSRPRLTRNGRILNRVVRPRAPTEQALEKAVRVPCVPRPSP